MTNKPSQKSKKRAQKIALWSLLALTITAIFLWVHNVPTTPDATDKREIEALLIQAGAPELLAGKAGAPTYEEQISQIRKVQSIILEAAPENNGIPRKETREPADLIAANAGLCYDRSRTIEKTLRLMGYEARHISIYKIADNSVLKTLLTPMASSHAITEVLTDKGWLVVDSNRRWISTDKNGKPVSIKHMRQIAQSSTEDFWLPENADEQRPKIYDSPFIALLGLYSRHGEFYPPMTPMPDINWAEFLQNFYGE
jgi:transglutaminase-like putative cysteine protease